MRWSDIDEHAQTWTVPGMFRKGGRTHVVPLPPMVLRILADLRPISGGTSWVFVGKRGASLANPARWTEAFRKASGLDFTLHDLRRTCATGCARLGASESTVSRILGHKAIAGTIAVSGIYDRFDRLPEIRSALVAWSEYVKSQVRGVERCAEVVAFGRRRFGHGRPKTPTRVAPRGSEPSRGIIGHAAQDHEDDSTRPRRRTRPQTR